MKSSDLTKEQKVELEKFGANTWFVEYLHKQYEENPDKVSEQWQNFFGKVSSSKKNNGESKNGQKDPVYQFSNVKMPEPQPDDNLQIIAGSAAKILENMNSSLTIPVATSQRAIPVKLLEENRILINQNLSKKNQRKISYTHLIAWSIVKAIMTNPVMNNAFTIIEGKPNVIKRKNINLGLAIDIEKRDGTHSLIVPNIKKSDAMNFSEFVKAYDDLVDRSRKGMIDPSEFMGTTVTLTNPGTIGTISSVPRLMLGQGTIVATGAIQYPVEYQAMAQSTISALGISKVMNLTSTYDHRIIQGAESGFFLKEINDLLLGANFFYEEIFEDLKIPLVPLAWQVDSQSQMLGNHSNREEIEKQGRVLQLINLYRVRGHLIASFDPLGSQLPYHAELDPASYKLTLWDLDREFITGGFGGIPTATLRDILDILQKTYCEKIGVEYMHIQNPAEKLWLQNKMEPVKNIPHFDPGMKKEILNKLIMAESFEHFIHNKFIGHKRFSLEGSETLIPVLDLLLNDASESGILEIVLGMAHRGRLNVLANIIGKSYDSIFTEFEDIPDINSIEGSGDVKYHLGASGRYKTRNGESIAVSVASNPSHLEWVNPVVEGIVRAKQTRLSDRKEHRKVMAVLIHGDAAFAGQGISAETLNLSQLSGYRTGGTIHIIINNQIGFTTTPEDARSSQYATDVAKMIQAPIFHVNGDDPEAALWVTKLAFEYRQLFKKDIVVDLFGYRRHGHNEGDEPGFTQPLLYEKIKVHPSVREIYSNILIKNKTLSQDEINQMNQVVNDSLSEAFDKIKRKKTSFSGDAPLAVSKEKMEAAVGTNKTGISEDMLKEIINGITKVPREFSVHPKLKKFLEKRMELLDGRSDADWATAESLAFGSLLIEGTPVRLSGQDSVRGTFSQRHLALTDIQTGLEYLPLNHIKQGQGKLEALDSFLSEAAVLGFEYGYSTADPLALVMWEAQFGDFANGAQVIIDNFIVASFEKWKLPNRVVMLLPHGFEGQGPEHSSARLERYLTLCAEDNIQVCNLTTPAQYFHVLRRQAKQAIGKPLIIMTPKSLLRLPEAKSKKEDFINGKFYEIIDDEKISNKDSVEKIIITSGKVYYDLIKFREANKISNSAVIRMEQYYPYKSKLIKGILASYKNVKRVTWVQEEPKNMGAWNFLASRLVEDLSEGQKLNYAGRPESASPAVGSAKKAAKQQAELVEEAFK
ncbi:MAG TPA: multifunctional oxoglutarate decarboxylase/oxoglutarate dehydrogenase thiamine pyrophosphate-binding subunit/dihydrolipoyllysine-residue succinyltransferase subunit [Ignavibacteriaceae bacterium]|nr:multifunctional oxoglutarate decarboxylase/oxoglutarate dehydrogenase thiamine pyrophosphate-binding subunit/dihydrolipoyllysine-residue succinyltransferase subunit [Ignavibacteriaceae bacterium]